jgi:non-heme chloroperoxidase
LLILCGDRDHTVPWSIVKASFRKQQRNAVVTELAKLLDRALVHHRQHVSGGC